MRLLKTIVVAVLLVVTIPGITLSRGNDNLLVGALSEIGAEPDMLDIVDWSLINREFIDFSKMEQYRDEILTIFEMDQEIFDSTKEYNETYRILNTKGKLNSDTFLQIIIQSVILPEEYEKDPQTYLVVAVSGRNHENFADFINKTRKAITSLEGQSKITSCVTGTFDGKLNEVKQGQILEKICGYFKISDTEKMKDDYTFNIMGFSPLLSEGVQILGKDYNINIAMRYNSEEDRTYIWIGTPIISLEY
ncbi:MAG: YwmB family TATA-box binding protein [Tepidanaerobacteraceae bacterium]|nr:YwmB family TATA-box binding protein [Tepidanaerobacteraceae bacterium]